MRRKRRIRFRLRHIMVGMFVLAVATRFLVLPLYERMRPTTAIEKDAIVQIMSSGHTVIPIDSGFPEGRSFLIVYDDHYSDNKVNDIAPFVSQLRRVLFDARCSGITDDGLASIASPAIAIFDTSDTAVTDNGRKRFELLCPTAKFGLPIDLDYRY